MPLPLPMHPCLALAGDGHSRLHRIVPTPAPPAEVYQNTLQALLLFEEAAANVLYGSLGPECVPGALEPPLHRTLAHAEMSMKRAFARVTNAENEMMVADAAMTFGEAREDLLNAVLQVVGKRDVWHKRES